jgi:hypothetical protein
VVTVTAHCPGATGNGKAWRHGGAVQRVLGGAQSLASNIEPLGPRQHPPPCDYVYFSVDGLYTCCWGTLRDGDDDFEVYSTAAIIAHRREHQAAGHHIPADACDDLQADAAEKRCVDQARSGGKDCRS